MVTFKMVGLTPRVKFLLVVGLTLLPMAGILLFVIISAYLPVFNAMDEIINISMKTVMPINKLEETVLRASMPPNDYIIYSNKSEKELFLRLSQEIETLFQSLQDSDYNHALKDAKEAWEIARLQGLELLSKTYQVADLKAYKAMEDFDANIDMTLHKLEPLINQIHNHINAQNMHLTNLKDKGLYITLFAFIIALVFGAGASILLSRDREKLKEFSEKDPLTGLYNRRSFDVRLKRETHAAITLKRSVFSLMIIDVDHFKKVNDNYGHQVGDQVLCALAAIAGKQIRSSDFVGRYGGEEFAIVSSETTKDQAYVLAERIRQTIENSAIPIGEGKSVNITVSIGISSFPMDADNGKDLISTADQALYMAKETGRNKVVRFGQ